MIAISKFYFGKQKMTFNVVHEKKAERLLTKQDFEIVFRTKIWLTTVCLFLLCLVVFLFFYFFGHWQNLMYDSAYPVQFGPK